LEAHLGTEAAVSEGGGGTASKLVVIGFMAAGKSTFARHAAERLAWPLADADAVLAERLGEPIPAFFEREGERAFRERERDVVLELLGAPGPAVVALGGGAVETADVRAALAGHVVLHVDVALAVAWSRARDSARPLARDQDLFAGLYERRALLYDSLARAVVTGGKQVDAAAEAALALIRPGVPADVRMLWCRAGAGSGRNATTRRLARVIPIPAASSTSCCATTASCPRPGATGCSCRHSRAPSCSNPPASSSGWGGCSVRR